MQNQTSIRVSSDLLNALKKFKEEKDSYEDVIWLMEKQSSFLANLGKNYTGLLDRAWKFVERRNLFTYNSKKNLVESVAKNLKNDF